jgi:hypothetical protein
LISALYDFALGVPLLVAPVAMAEMMGAGPVQPVINGQLNGLFTFTLGLGYLWAAGDVQARRGYLWIAGVFAKAAGASLFVYDHFARQSPDSFLLFAATDGTLAVVTLIALVRAR